MEISPMTLSDLEEIKENLEKDFNSFWNFEIFKSELVNTNASYLVIRLHSQIIGYAGFQKILEEANLMNIVIKKDMRKKGYACLLLQELILLAKSKNCSSITLEVNEHNLSAINLYKKFSFKSIGLRKNYYQGIDNAIIMTKEITSF